jgi:uncharacterized NAD(P)/FAD-binding protein YdhS
VPESCDIAIIGGGFSGLAALANIVRKAPAFPAQTPLRLALFTREVIDGSPAAFGPAYATPRDEHLLNVRAAAMGFFADDIPGFFDWTQKQGVTAKGTDYLPRRLYARYLTAMLAETRALAAQKNIALSVVRADVEDIVDAGKNFHIVNGGAEAAGTARLIVLAPGNALKSKAESDARGKLVTDPWSYDYKGLAADAAVKNIALIGAGLTALDALISLFDSGWQGKITCFSNSGLLPMAHPDIYAPEQIIKLEAKDFLGKRLSAILRRLRQAGENGDWRYAVDGLRPFTQALWKSLSTEDKRRLAGKYFTLWNVHRHRCDAGLRRAAEAAIADGRLKMVKARCRSTRAINGPGGEGIELELQTRKGTRRETFDLAFSCAGVNYAVANSPLLSRLISRGLLEGAGNPWGVRASEDFLGYKSPAGALYVLGAPLFGHLFETTAVPELRFQAAAIAERVIAALSGLSQSRAAGSNGPPGAPPRSSATGAP